jgi:hypothetical protein
MFLCVQLRWEWMGAGILPPRLMKPMLENLLTGITGAEPSNPP